MILSNLSVLLAEQKMKITDLSTQTKLSRTTLTSLYYNTGDGIRLDTLNKICEALRVEPGDVLKYYPLQIGSFDSDEIALSEDSDGTTSFRFILSMKLRILGRDTKEQIFVSGRYRSSIPYDDEGDLLAFCDVDLVYPKSLMDYTNEMPRIFESELHSAISEQVEDKLALDFEVIPSYTITVSNNNKKTPE